MLRGPRSLFSMLVFISCAGLVCADADAEQKTPAMPVFPALTGTPPAPVEVCEPAPAPLFSFRDDDLAADRTAAAAFLPAPDLRPHLEAARRAAAQNMAKQAMRLRRQGVFVEAERLGALASVLSAPPFVLPTLSDSTAPLPIQTAEARRRFQAGQGAAAAAAYAVAYAQSPQAPFLFDSAQALRRAGELGAAYALYQRFLVESPGTPLARETVGYLFDVEAAVRKSRRSRRLTAGLLGAAVLAIGLGIGVGVGVNQAGIHHDELVDLGFKSVRF